jgi:hypothetical protein
MRRRLRKAGERMQPGFGDSIRQPLGAGRTSDFRDSDGDRIDDRDQRRPGGININEKRRNRSYRNGERVSIHPQPPTYGGKPGNPDYGIDRGPDRPIIRQPVDIEQGGGYKPQPFPMPSDGRGPVARPQPFPMPDGGGNRPQPFPMPDGGGGLVARPQPFPMPGGNDVRDIRGTNDPRNRKKRSRNSGGGIRY